MPSINVGYCRIYEALGCFPGELIDANTRILISTQLAVEIYIGPNPPHLRFTIPEDKYAIPADPDNFDKFMTPTILPHPLTTGGNKPTSSQSSTLYTQITCWITVHTSDATLKALRQGSEEARDETLALAKKHISDLTLLLELSAGVLGLRVHKQFALRQLLEGLVIPFKTNYFIEATSDFIELLDPVKLSKNSMERISQGFTAARSSRRYDWRSQAPVLRWLMRAWNEQDKVNQFVALFVPLEMILQGHKLEPNEQLLIYRNSVRKLIEKHGGVETGKLLSFFHAFVERQQPTLAERFASFAERAQLPGWQDDIVAFKHYTKTRNDIVHRGETNISLHLAEVKEELPHLIDLAERYVCYAVFGDVDLYLSRTRRIDLDQTPGKRS